MIKRLPRKDADMAIATPTREEATRILASHRQYLDYVPTNLCFVDLSYGRIVRDIWLKELAETWDFQACAPLLLSRRLGGDLAIMDGQHRWLAGKENNEALLPAQVYVGLSVEREAALYRAFNKKAQQSGMDIFKARCASGDADALRIREVIESRGLAIAWNNKKSSGHLAAIGAAEKIYGRYGVEDGAVFLGQVLDLVLDTWPGQPIAYSANFLEGAAGFLVRYGAIYDRRRFVERCGRAGANQVMAKASDAQIWLKSERTSTRDSHGYYGMAMRQIYNAGLRTNLLPEWRAKMELPTVERSAKMSDAAKQMQARRREKEGK